MNKISKKLLQEWLPLRKKAAYKNCFGHLVIIAGNEFMGGAAIMASEGAIQSGVGLLTIVTHHSNFASIHARLPEAMVMDIEQIDVWTDQLHQRATGILLGPGLGNNYQQFSKIWQSLKWFSQVRYLVLDADGLHHYLALPTKEKNLPYPLILTPHPGEFAAFVDQQLVSSDEHAILAWVRENHFILVKKSEETKVYLPCDENNIWVNPFGNPGMATGGMGDTLAGMIGGLGGQFHDLPLGVLFAVGLHSYCADLLYKEQYSVRPTKVSQLLPKVMGEWRNKKLKQRDRHS